MDDYEERIQIPGGIVIWHDYITMYCVVLVLPLARGAFCFAATQVRKF
jgi:hypothetical protein